MMKAGISNTKVNPGINPWIPWLTKFSPEIPGLEKCFGIIDSPITNYNTLTIFVSYAINLTSSKSFVKRIV